MKLRLTIFWSPGFILGLILLVLNDHYLKSAFPGFFTGKLSDFAGLFIFPIFFAAFLPRFKKHIYWITTIGFIFWKSELSNFIIEGWNEWGIFPIQRIVDYTDLVAVCILPFSWWYFVRYKGNSIRLNPTPVILVSAFAFMATSKAPEKITINYRHSFNFSLDTLKSHLFFNDQINIRDGHEYRQKWQNLHSLQKNSADSIAIQYEQEKNELIFNTVKDSMWIYLPDTFCHDRGFEMRIILSGTKDKSSMYILEATHYCYKRKEEAKKRLRQTIEEKLIQPFEK